MIKRREFIAGLGAAAWPLGASGQQPAVPVIGLIGTQGRSGQAFLKGLREIRSGQAFLKGLRETGYIEGQNVAIEYRSTELRNDPLSALPLAKDLVERRVSVIVASTVPLAIGARSATQTVPIVFRAGTDPVAAGLVASLNRPGANVTGISTFSQDLGPKRLELLREFLPAGASIVQAAASLLGLRLSILNVSSLIEVDAAFASLDHQVVSGLLIINDVSFFQWRAHIVALAARKPIPAIFADRLFAEAGGLMSYGTDIPDGYRLTGVYTGRILKGEKPADLPVQLSNKFEFILNLKTAKALGLTVPQSILLRADEVIE